MARRISVIIALLLSSSYSSSPSSSSSSSCFKVCPKLQPQQSTFHCLIWKYSACHPSTIKQPCNPPEVKYSLSPSSSDQLLEQHLSDMAPMTAPYSSVSTPHAGRRGFIGSKLRLMGVGWGTLISCHGKTKSSVNGSCYTVVGMDQLLVYK